MVAQVGALRVTVGADITGLQTGMRRAQRQVAQSAGVMQKSVASVGASFKSMGAMFGVAIGGAALVGATRGLLGLADASKQLRAQLTLATQEYGSFAQANKDVQRIAETTRTGLSETANLYAVFQRNAKELGISQAQAARATETVNKTFQISGASAAEAAGGLRQFLQALQSGQLRGEEFNSVMENAPRLARLLADSLGVTIGELRALAKEGQITGDKLVAALTDRKFTDAIDAEFRELPVTFDQAMTQIHNAAVITFGAFDQGGQFSSAFASFITGGSQGFAEMEARAYYFGSEIRAIMDGVGAAFQQSRDTGVDSFLSLEGAAFSLRDAIWGILAAIDGVKNAFANLINAPGNLVRGVLGKPMILNPSDMAGKFWERSGQSLTDSARRRIMGRDADDVLAEFGMGRTPPPFSAPAGKGAKAKKGPKGSSAETLAKRAEREMEQKLRRDAQFAAEQRQNQIALLRAEQELTTSTETRTDLALQILEIERAQELAQIDLAVKLGDRTEAEAEALRLQTNDLTQLKKEAVLREQEAKQREEAAMLEDTRREVVLDQLQAESALATTAEEARAIQLRILDHQYELERLALERILADRDATAAAKEDARIRLAALGARHSAERAGVVAGTRGPLEAWAASIPQTAAQINEAFQSIQVNAIEGLSTAITDLISGTKSLADAFGDMARSIISDIIAMTVRMLIFRTLAAAFPGVFGQPAAVPPVPTPRAAGGPVMPGRDYLIGEEGPEIVRFGASGQVIPNHEIGMGGSFTIHQHYSFEGVAITEQQFVRGLALTKHDTIAAIKDLNRR